MQVEKVCICGLAEVPSPQEKQIHKLQIPQIQKRLRSQIANMQSATFAEGQQIEQIIWVCKFADLLFAELICGLPIFAFYTMHPSLHR